MDEALGLLPLALKWGKVGTFHLSVPWNALGARPLVITLTDVTLVFRLLNPEEDGYGDDEGDGGLEAEARRRQRAAKERAVQVRKNAGAEGLAGPIESTIGSLTITHQSLSFNDTGAAPLPAGLLCSGHSGGRGGGQRRAEQEPGGTHLRLHARDGPGTGP